jgi:hypothetical protein
MKSRPLSADASASAISPAGSALKDGAADGVVAVVEIQACDAVPL